MYNPDFRDPGVGTFSTASEFTAHARFVNSFKSARGHDTVQSYSTFMYGKLCILYKVKLHNNRIMSCSELHSIG